MSPDNFITVTWGLLYHFLQSIRKVWGMDSVWEWDPQIPADRQRNGGADGVWASLSLGKLQRYGLCNKGTRKQLIRSATAQRKKVKPGKLDNVITLGAYKEPRWCMNHLLMTNCCTFLNWMDNKMCSLKITVRGTGQSFPPAELPLTTAEDAWGGKQSKKKKPHFCALLCSHQKGNSRFSSAKNFSQTMISPMPMQAQNHLWDVNKIILGLYFWMQDPLLGCAAFPQQKGQYHEAEPFPSLHTVLTPAGTGTVIFATQILISKRSLTSGSRQQNR